MAAYFKKYSKNIMSMIVVFTFVAALFCPSDDFLAVTEVGTKQYSVFLGGPSVSISEQFTDTPVDFDIFSESLELAGFNYDWSDVGVSYFSVTITNRSYTGSDFSGSVQVYFHPYILYGGQKYYLMPVVGQSSVTEYRGYFAIPTSGYSYSVGMEISGYISSFGENNYYIPAFDVAIHNTFYTFTDEELTSLSGNSEIVSVLREQVQLDNDIIDKLESLIDSQEEANGILQSIYLKLCELFTMLGGGGIEDVPTDDITDLEDKEDALIGEVNPEDAADDLVVTIDPNGSNLLWTVFDNVITSNSDVFTAFITLLSLGVVALILNR